ncbi:MAG: uL15 family ribosomal protein [Clostridia bacterium]|nr:uL15 family ribosomal protein [Clostridia bacterium]
MKKLRTKAKGFLALLMTLVMLLGVCLPTAALGVTVPEDATYDDLCWSLTYEDGVVSFKINPDVVYDILKDKKLSKEELKALIPEDVLETLELGKNVTIDDLMELASNYVTLDELKAIVNDMPEALVSEFLDLDLLSKLIDTQELMNLIPMDDIINAVEEDALKKLLTDEVVDLMFKEDVINAIVDDAFISKILNETTLVDDITTDPVIKGKLIALVTDEVVTNILADPQIKQNLQDKVVSQLDFEEILNKPGVIDSVINVVMDSAHKTKLDAFIANDTVEAKLMTGVTADILSAELISDLIENGAIGFDVIEAFTDAQIKGLINGDVLDELMANNAFVSDIMNGGLFDSLLTDDDFIENLVGINAVTSIFTPEYLSDNNIIGYTDITEMTGAINTSNIADLAIAKNLAPESLINNGLVSVNNGVDQNTFKDSFDNITDDLIWIDLTAAGTLSQNAVISNLYTYYAENFSVSAFFEDFQKITTFNTPTQYQLNILSITVNDLFTYGVINKTVVNVNTLLANENLKARLVNHVKTTPALRNQLIAISEVKNLIAGEILNLDKTQLVALLENHFSVIAGAINNNDSIATIKGYLNDANTFNAVMAVIDPSAIIAELDNTTLKTIVTNSGVFSDDTCVSIFMTTFDPLTDSALIDAAFGGYDAIINDYVDIKVLLVDVIGVNNVTRFFSVDSIVTAVGVNNLINYVDIKDVIAEAGGPAELAKMYSNDELKAIFEAIGTDNIKAFIQESGILEAIDVKAILSDVIDYAKTKAPEVKAAVKEVLQTAYRLLMTKVDGIYLNGTKIFNGAQFDVTAILVAIVDLIPDVEDLLNIGVDGTVFETLITLDVQGKTYEYGFNASFNGDPAELLELISDFSDNFKLDVDENLNIDVYVALPEVVSSIYETALTHEKVPQTVKDALVLLPSKTVGELKDTLEGILTNDELYDAIYEKLDDIKAKAYDKINERFGDKDVVAKAQAKVDELLDKFATKENYDKVVDKALALADKVTSSFDASLPIQKLYDGNGQFSFSAALSFDFIEALNKIVSKYIAIPEEVVVLFTSTEISASLDATVVVDGLYQLTVIDEYGDEFITYLPAGISLDVLKDANGMTVVDDNAEAVTEMPAEDCVLNSSLRYYVEFVIGDTVVYREFYNIGDTTVTEPDLKSDEYTQYIENYNPYEYIYSWEDYTLGEQKVTTVKMVTTDAYEYTYVTFVDEDGNVLEYVKDGETVKAEKVEFAYGAEESEILAFAKTLTASANKIVTINGYVQFATDATYTNEQTVTVLYDVKKITLNVTFDSTPEDAKPAYKTESAISLLSTTGDTDTLSVPYGATLEEIQKLIKDTYLVGKVSNPDNYLIIVNGYSADADSDVAQNITVTYKLATLSLTVNDVAGGTTAALVKDYSYSDYANYAEMLAAINADVAEHFTKTGHTASLAKFEEAAADTQTVTYTANKYKAEFYVDGELYKTVEFTYGAESIDAPAVPDKTGYTGAWDRAYQKGDMDIKINAKYTANTYSVKWYMDDSKTELIQEKAWEFANSSTYPSHPANNPNREGYTFKGWSIATLDFTKAGDIEVWATWESKTPVTPPDEPDEPTDPNEPGSSTEPDDTTAPDGTDTDTDTDTAEPSFFDTTGKYFLWIGLLLILILVAAGIVVYINKSRKDNEPEPTPDPEPTPEPEAEPEAEPEVEEEPEVEVEEELHTVDHVSAEEADSMMSDSDAMKLVVTKKAAVVAGQKAIINLSTINSKFEAGETVNIEALKAKKLIPAKTTKLKVLGSGNVDKPLNVEAHAFSLQAVKMITLTGGTATQIVSE